MDKINKSSENKEDLIIKNNININRKKSIIKEINKSSTFKEKI